MRHANNRVKVSNVAVSDANGVVALSIGDALTTASADTLSAYRDIQWAKKRRFERTIAVPTMSMDGFLNSILGEPRFELLVVDVEGFEERVFKTFDISHWQPKMMIVELNDYHRDFVESPQLQLSSRRVRDRVFGLRYMQVYADYINTIFVHNSMR